MTSDNGEYRARHDKAMAMPQMQRDYLDDKNLKGLKLPGVSAIVPTYNRAPHSVEDDANPLGWCLESLVAQRGGSLDEIIVFDDASTDYTPGVVADFQRRSPIPIRYFRNEENTGSSKTRNLAVEASKNERVIFLDDDCIFSPYFVFGANYTLDSLPETAAAVHMPVYHRRLDPVPVPKPEIGVLDLETAKMEGNFGGFPIEFSRRMKKHYLNKRLGVVKPIQINNLGGVFIAKKEPFQAVGGFPEDLTWRNGYREETRVAIALQNAGHTLHFSPDPKFYSVHLKYGARASEEEAGQKDSKLKRLIDHSNILRENTGNRVDAEEWFFDRIISTYVTLGQQDIEAARRYLERTQRRFVEDNELAMSGVGTKIEDPELRKVIFTRAITEGSKLLKGVAAL